METTKTKTIKKIKMTLKQEKAFNILYAKNKAIIYNFIMSQGFNYIDAEEVTQKIFIKAARLFHTYDENLSAFNTWLFIITKHQIIDYYKTNHSSRYISIADFVNPDGDANFQFNTLDRADKEIESKEKQEIIIKSFNKFKGNHRKISMLYFINQYSYEKIAIMLNVPLGTIKGTISRCRELLKEDLKSIYLVKKSMS